MGFPLLDFALTSGLIYVSKVMSFIDTNGKESGVNGLFIL